MRRIFVTGGARFIGNNFVRHLAAKYPSYHQTVVDALTSVTKVITHSHASATVAAR
ncbi:MAG TPA: hypothetical protein VGA23_07430 [Methylomirabilota bacterium]